MLKMKRPNDLSKKTKGLWNVRSLLRDIFIIKKSLHLLFSTEISSVCTSQKTVKSGE